MFPFVTVYCLLYLQCLKRDEVVRVEPQPQDWYSISQGLALSQGPALKDRNTSLIPIEASLHPWEQAVPARVGGS